ncbi:uncharacterized protein TNCV_4822171 [Trichonephila clavipes]|nr:uncharacterized protein TNCV_4822171 [Trichonephila clavipes]
MEIRTSSYDINSSSYKSNNFESMQPRSNESQYSRKNGSGERRELEEKGISFKKDQGEKHTDKTDKRGPLMRSPPGSWTEPRRKFKISKKETLGCKRSRDSGSGGPKRKQRKGQKNQVEKRQLTVTNYSELKAQKEI